MCDAYGGNPMEFIYVVLAILIFHVNKNEIQLQVNSNARKFAYIKKQATQLQKEHRANPFISIIANSFDIWNVFEQCMLWPVSKIPTIIQSEISPQPLNGFEMFS